MIGAASCLACFAVRSSCRPVDLAVNEARLHLYGKREPRPRRKMGHLTALASSGAEAAGLVRTARESLCTRKS